MKDMRKDFSNGPKIDTKSLLNDNGIDEICSTLTECSDLFEGALKKADLNLKEYVTVAYNKYAPMLSKETITLYRGVVLGPEEMEPDMTNPGMSWTYSSEGAEKFVDNILEGFDDNPDFAPCIMTAKFNVNDIDLVATIAANIEEPSEEEIRLYKDSKPIDIEYQVL